MKYKKMLVVVFIVIALLVIIGIYSLNKTKVKTLDINSELVQELYKRVNPSSDGAILNNMYNDKKEFDNGYILATGFHNIIDGEEFIVQYISEKDLESSIRKVFGKNISFKHEDVYIYRDFYCGYKYNSDNKNYEFISGCDGDTNNYYYREIVDAVENKDELLNLINEEQQDIKKEYAIHQVYPPNGFDIEEYVTYDEDIASANNIYQKIKEQSDILEKIW